MGKHPHIISDVMSHIFTSHLGENIRSVDFTLFMRQGKHNEILTSWYSQQLPVAQATLCEQEATIWDTLHFFLILFLVLLQTE